MLRWLVEFVQSLMELWRMLAARGIPKQRGCFGVTEEDETGINGRKLLSVPSTREGCNVPARSEVQPGHRAQRDADAGSAIGRIFQPLLAGEKRNCRQ